jgi:hypothetical protein
MTINNQPIYMTQKCPSGEIMRKGYSFTNKHGTRVTVGPTCVKDRGKPGKTPKSEQVLPKLKKGRLGWKKDMNEDARHTLLKKRVDQYSYKRVVAMLNAVINYTTDAETEKKMKADRAWLRHEMRPEKYGAGTGSKIVPIAIIAVVGLMIFLYIRKRNAQARAYACPTCPR